MGGVEGAWGRLWDLLEWGFTEFLKLLLVWGIDVRGLV